MSIDVNLETLKAFDHEKSLLDDRKKNVLADIGLIAAEIESLIAHHEMMLRVLTSIRDHVKAAQKEETAKQLIDKVHEERKEHEA